MMKFKVGDTVRLAVSKLHPYADIRPHTGVILKVDALSAWPYSVSFKEDNFKLEYICDEDELELV